MNYQNLQDTENAVVRGKFIPLQAFMRSKEKFHIKNMIAQLKKLKNDQPKEPKADTKK